MTEVRTAARTLDLLEYFAQIEDPTSLAAVTSAFDMPKSSVLGLLRTLCARGYLLKDERGLYVLNEAFRNQGFGWTNSRLTHLLKQAEPLLNRLAEKTGETLLVGVLTNDGLVKFVMQSLPLTAFRYQIALGHTIPVHCTGMGRMLLSQLPPEKQNALLAKHPLGTFTHLTLTDIGHIRDEIARAAQQGYCIVKDEYDDGGTAIAVPIHEANGQTLGALNFACLSSRFENKREMLLRELLQAKVELTNMLATI